MIRTIPTDQSPATLVHEREVPQLQLFRGADPAQVAQEVNAWLGASGARVVGVNQSLCEHGGKLVFILSILYAGRYRPAGRRHRKKL